jgi:hypothetical protein
MKPKRTNDPLMKQCLALHKGVMEDYGIGLPKVGQRHILIVSSYVITSANYVQSTGIPANSQTSIQLLGKASPSSDPKLIQAYLHFVPNGTNLRSPRYIQRNGYSEIRLEYHECRLAAALETLSQFDAVYCWYGEFQNGHTYGDLHGGGSL